MIYIGIDPATINTGVAIFENDTLLSYHLVNVGNESKRGDKEQDDAFRRIPIMTSRVEELLRSYKSVPSTIIIEYSREYKVNIDILIKLSMQIGSIWDMLESYGFNVKLVLPNVWRKELSLTGGKNTKRQEFKKRALDFVKDKFDITPTIDEAEAICIAYAGYLMDQDEKENEQE